MKTYILDIIPKIQKFSQRIDDLSILLDKHWVVLDEETSNKSVFIFRKKDNQLLISENGKIEKGSWEYLGNNSLLIERNNGSFLYKHGFVDDCVLALKIDGKDEYALLINDEWFEKQLKTIAKILDFLHEKYIDKKENPDIYIPNYTQEKTSNIDKKQIPLTNTNLSPEKLKNKKRIVKFNSVCGELKIFTNKEKGYQVGDSLVINDKIPVDGKVKTGFWNYMIVENGIITKIK